MALRRAFVAGVGMTKFEKPSISTRDYPEMVKEAVNAALKDAGVSYGAVEQACVGYVLGDSTSGQRALYDVGMTGIPIINVNNNAATGSSALYLAYQLVRGGLRKCVLAVGFEKMDKENFRTYPKFPNQAIPLKKFVQVFKDNHEVEQAIMTAQLFGAAGREHMAKYGTTAEHFAKIALKNHKHGAKNQTAQHQQEYTLRDITDSPVVYAPLTRLQCSPLSHGAAAAVIVSEDILKNPQKSVEIVGMEMATDLPSTFEEKSCIKMIGFDMTKKAADALYANTGLGPKEIDVVELHDCFSTNELITYEALGLCPVGKGGEMVDRGDNTYGGKYVINPSGGLISKGHPLGATGIAQCAELSWQLRNDAGERQVVGAKIGLQHNLGLGGAVVVAMYRRGIIS